MVQYVMNKIALYFIEVVCYNRNVVLRKIATDERIYELRISCNDLDLDICINKNDLIGEPEVGRRFKGVIWLQGNVHF